MSVSNTLPVELIGVVPFQKPCAGGRHSPTAIWRRAEGLKRNYNMKKRLNRENRVSGCANQAIWPEKFLGSVCTGERGGIRSRPPQFGARDCSSLGELFKFSFRNYIFSHCPKNVLEVFKITSEFDSKGSKRN